MGLVRGRWVNKRRVKKSVRGMFSDCVRGERCERDVDYWPVFDLCEMVVREMRCLRARCVREVCVRERR